MDFFTGLILSQFEGHFQMKQSVKKTTNELNYETFFLKKYSGNTTTESRRAH